MLSLKKAADPGDESWSLGQPTIRTMRFVGDLHGVSMKDEILLWIPTGRSKVMHDEVLDVVGDLFAEMKDDLTT